MCRTSLETEAMERKLRTKAGRAETGGRVGYMTCGSGCDDPTVSFSSVEGGEIEI